MKNYNQVEIILFSKYSITDVRQRQLVRWLGTTVQDAIGFQHGHAKKMFLKILKDTPAIYMS
ncbi:MAG: hypothetical protein H7122_07570 [Chitinophagaceae bacterium]|nr:hypothetical protein [Chitinophagaceae bacterium]